MASKELKRVESLIRKLTGILERSQKATNEGVVTLGELGQLVGQMMDQELQAAAAEGAVATRDSSKKKKQQQPAHQAAAAATDDNGGGGGS